MENEKESNLYGPGWEEKSPYEKFYEHVEEWEKNGIPYGTNDLIRIAKRYDCEIPKIVDGKLKFDTI